MNIEYEARVIDIDINDITSKLDSLGAIREDEYFYKRYIFLVPGEKSKWMRLRTDGKISTLAYKSVDEEETINGTKEIEIVVDDFDKTKNLLEAAGHQYRNYQENKRIRYILNNVEIDIDTWPMIPSYLEVEGKSEEEVNSILSLLDVKKENITFMHCESIYKHYGYDIEDIKELHF